MKAEINMNYKLGGYMVSFRKSMDLPTVFNGMIIHDYNNEHELFIELEDHRFQDLFMRYDLVQNIWLIEISRFLKDEDASAINKMVNEHTSLGWTITCNQIDNMKAQHNK